MNIAAPGYAPITQIEPKVEAVPVTRPAPTRATVAVVTLVDGETVSWSWVQSMRALEDHDRTHRRHIGTIAHVRASAGSLGKARNQAVAGFLRSRDEWLLNIDSDHGFGPDLLDRLLSVAHPQHRPVVGALTFGISLDQLDGMGGYRPEVRLVAFNWDGVGFQRYLEYPENTVWRVSATGTGVLLMHRSVLEAIGSDWFDTRRDNRGKELGEDLSFMLRLVEADIPVHIHTGIPTTHHKPQWIGPQDYVPPSQ